MKNFHAAQSTGRIPYIFKEPASFEQEEGKHSRGYPTNTRVCSPPSPTLEEMAVQGVQSSRAETSTLSSTFLTSSFELLDPCNVGNPSSRPARGRAKTRKKPNIVRQLGPAF